jgi:hypothetical protein
MFNGSYEIFGPLLTSTTGNSLCSNKNDGPAGPSFL